MAMGECSASRRVRGVLLDYQEDIGRDRPRGTDNRLSVLSAVFTWDARKSRIEDTPPAGRPAHLLG